MKNDFCEALKTNDRRRLQELADSVLGCLDLQECQQLNFKKIEIWISSNNCVASVSASPYLLDTDPPVKEFILNLRDGSVRTLGLRLSPSKWEIIIK
ncbi:MAG TPA: hypothetical protein PLZ75_06375 [Bacteroidales bacterium]|jgi:hypothetical protein|nr:hypothetical protein [Bacteroidales bacterium]HQH24554.1 hypothetical protein [Bacteroidales bacterium]HQJ83293.1 hypothetical protein [Bacteroidales bacterium]